MKRISALAVFLIIALCFHSLAHAEYLGRYSKNRYQSSSTSNPYGAGSPYAPNGVNNPYSPNGSPYSPQGARNQYTTGGPKLYGNDGQFLGNLNAMIRTL